MDHLSACLIRGVPVGSAVKNPPAMHRHTRDTGLIPGLGRSSGGGHSNHLQYSCQENPMDKGAWQAMGRGIPKMRLKQLGMHAQD